ncbi:MAG: deoxyguanosinetriphosphate triphosphohydrolase [Candidatus Sumerlaeia bacterium]|nr:deoxyguanosinetriphosphate triphosphohydrolase [Candidatus Sumerlaeia bacterium]
MLTREHLQEAEDNYLAPYAMHSSKTRGRAHEIRPDRLRTEFQRDRDRVIHSMAFRKLEFKTQVHVITAGDYFRTRLTHTMEVAQIARTLARSLRLNSDLAEAIALSHDFGHTPFGHAGEDAMREAMREAGAGGFEHNEQGLRTVEILEERSAEHPGLNLTYEVREGIIKHDTAFDKPSCDARYHPEERPTLESQLVDLADEIAYNNADLDDALVMGLIEVKDLKAAPWVLEYFDEARRELGGEAPLKFVTYRALGRLYSDHVEDALTHSEGALRTNAISSIEDVRRFSGRLVDFSPEFKQRLKPLKRLLLERVYFHPGTLTNSLKARRMLKALFEQYHENPVLLPWKYQRRIETDGKARVVCDYIAGMTDRFFIEQYERIFLPDTHR